MPSTLEQINTILFEHDYLESNIPMGHCYWDLLTKLRAGVEDAPMCVYNEPKAAPPIPTKQIQDTVKLGILRAQNINTLNTFGRESNIPYTHTYWFNKNVISAIERQPIA